MGPPPSVSSRDQILRVDFTNGAAAPIASASPRNERPIVDALGRWLVLGTWRGAPARVVDLRTDATAITFDQSSVRAAFSPDGALLAVGLPGRCLVFNSGRWDSPREFQIVEPGLSTVAGASAVAPDGALMAYIEPPHTVRLADPRTTKILATLPNAERYGHPRPPLQP